jgi:hypothetical protein
VEIIAARGNEKISRRMTRNFQNSRKIDFKPKFLHSDFAQKHDKSLLV